MNSPRSAPPTQQNEGFENPYNFIPCLPRKDAQGQPIAGPLGDGRPVGHDRHHPDLFSGYLEVKLTTCTPLLILDTSGMRVDSNGHKTYNMRKDAQGRPLLPATALRGMLRSAYEAITNSRLGLPLPKGAPPVDPTLRPASRLEELSPADRVFGWVNPQGQGAHKGQLRIGHIRCLTPAEQAIQLQRGGQGLTLAPLMSPDSSSRHYREPQPKGQTKGSHKSETAGLIRGRKVYPHHTTFDNGRESFAKKSRFNLSIREWVAPGTVFSFRVQVQNLSLVELGALIFCLHRSDDTHHRLGAAKPLGFGSVSTGLVFASCELQTGRQIAQRYGSLLDGPDEAANVPMQPMQLIKDAWSAYKDEFTRCYGGESGQRIHGAFRHAAKGSGLKVRYPKPNEAVRDLPGLWEENRNLAAGKS